MATIGNPPHSTHPWSTLLALATLSTTCSWRENSESYSECMYSPDPLSAFCVRCCSVPACFLFHCSTKFCNTKWYGNSYKIMQLEVETSSVHHFKDVQSWSDVAPHKQHFWSDSPLFRYSGMDQHLLQHTTTAEHFHPVLLMTKASFSPNPSSESRVFRLLQQDPAAFDFTQLFSYKYYFKEFI